MARVLTLFKLTGRNFINSFLIRIPKLPYKEYFVFVCQADNANAARMVNNFDWTKDMSAIELLRDVGKYFRMGTMLAKDTVARRLASDEGISFTEFSYQILQGMDFLELNRRHGVTLQTGGKQREGGRGEGA